MPIEEIPQKSDKPQRKPNDDQSDTSNSEMEMEEECKNQEQEPFRREFELEEHIDCLDTVNHWLNAIIINIRDNQIRVHYNGWAAKYDEWIHMNSPRILKQWQRGQEFMINNRLDILDERDTWLEARVIEMTNDRIKIHYRGYASKFDEWLPKNSKRIAEVGLHSKAYGGAKYRKDSGKNEHREKLKAARDEKNFTAKLQQKGLMIKEIGGDGNCLFRAFADQLYGNQDWHDFIRKICMDYIELEKNFYKNYIIGGGSRFDEYLERKRKDGVWGDDLEIQALSEIYDRSIQIYAYSGEPMRTFHEVSTNNQEPIRLSYHGSSHYNSIKKIGQENDGVLDNEPGVLEDVVLRNSRTRLENRNVRNANVADFERTDSTFLSEALGLSRAEFENKGRRDMEIALEESLQSFYEQQSEKVVDKELEETIKESIGVYEEQKNEEDLVKMIMNQTKVDQEKAMEAELQRAIEESKKNAEGFGGFGMDHVNQYPPGVQQAIDAGFPADYVMSAYSVVGDNPDLIISFIYENFM